MANEQQLSSVLIEFARTVITDFPIQGILDHLVTQIVEVMPVDAAGVTLIAAGQPPRDVAASDESALRYEHLQTALAEGPCLLAHESRRAVAVPNLATDRRFPSFGPRAVTEGLNGVFAFPLRHGDEGLGALDLYRRSTGRLDIRSMGAAQTLADVAAAYLLNARAREELQERADRAHQLSLHDPLTGLPNRTLLLERLHHAVDRALRDGHRCAVLYIDLDDFKLVNDTYGHTVGDALLVEQARQLTRAVRPGDTLARLAGDEFVVLCEDLSDEQEAEQIAERVARALDEPFVVSGRSIRSTASVGLAYSGHGDQLPRQLLEDADAAMYLAKRRPKQQGMLDLRATEHPRA